MLPSEPSCIGIICLTNHSFTSSKPHLKVKNLRPSPQKKAKWSNMVFFHPKGSGLILLGGQDVWRVSGFDPPHSFAPAGGGEVWLAPQIRRFSQRSWSRSNELEQCKKKGNATAFLPNQKRSVLEDEFQNCFYQTGSFMKQTAAWEV